jgi:hypothetical protein
MKALLRLVSWKGGGVLNGGVRFATRFEMIFGVVVVWRGSHRVKTHLKKL